MRALVPNSWTGLQRDRRSSRFDRRALCAEDGPLCDSTDLRRGCRGGRLSVAGTVPAVRQECLEETMNKSTRLLALVGAAVIAASACTNRGGASTAPSAPAPSASTTGGGPSPAPSAAAPTSAATAAASASPSAAASASAAAFDPST